MVTTSEAPRASFGAADRIRANLPQMSHAMVKIADLVLANPTSPIELSITELADRAGASAATVTRFCRLVGYSGYPQFRVALATELGERGTSDNWTREVSREFAADDSPEHILRNLLSTHTRSVEETASLVDLDRAAEIARAIWRARHLDIYGIGGSASAGAELQNRLYRVGVNCHAWAETHDGLASAVLQDEHCVALAISVSGRTVEVVDMLTRARAAGAMTVAITSVRDSPLARVADVVIPTSTPDPYLQPGDLTVRPSQLLVLDLLYLLIVQQDFTAAAARLVSTRIAVSEHRRAPGKASA